MLMFAIGALALATCPARNGLCAEKTNMPNVVFILADDLGYGDVHCLNVEHSKIATPCMDRLVSQGMSFTDAHSSSAVCSPSRYGILTGRYNWRSRLQKSVLLPYDDPLIAKGRLTVPKFLSRQGYQTAAIGKWHLGWQWPGGGRRVLFDRPIGEGPTTRGFDYFFGMDAPNFPPYGFIENDRLLVQPTIYLSKQDRTLEIGGFPGPMVAGWQTDQILPTLTAKAVDYIGKQAHGKKPFFLYFAMTSPHEPVVPSAQFKGKSGISALADWIMETDWSVGQVVDAVDHNGLADNTLVFFASDNGHCAYTHLELLLKAGHLPSQRFRGYKADIWEGGHRIPFVARWTGKIKAGTTYDQTVCLTDLMATCADVLGKKLPDNAGEDSVSLWPVLEGDQSPRREAIVHHSGNGRFSIRQGQWKLELCPGSGWTGSGGLSAPGDKEAEKMGLPSNQLYDMATDDVEKKNVQAQHPDVVARLTKLLEKYVKEGRSTPGKQQKNDRPIDIWKEPKGDYLYHIPEGD